MFEKCDLCISYESAMNQLLRQAARCSRGICLIRSNSFVRLFCCSWQRSSSKAQGTKSEPVSKVLIASLWLAIMKILYIINLYSIIIILYIYTAYVCTVCVYACCICKIYYLVDVHIYYIQHN